MLTCSVRVQIYNMVTKLVVKNLSRFQKTAYGATFRQDGRLLAAGDEEGHVKLFDTTSRSILRLFKGHKAPVHRTYFTADKLQLASFADDKSVRLWDVANEKVVKTYEDAHSDYIRAGAMHPQAGHMFVSGGYDGKINLYDTRAEQAITRTLDHGSPVESMLFLPNGSVFISAGGTQIRVWDLISGCRLLTTISQHHKTITCLQLGSDGRRLLSGGLDRHVKIYDVSTYKTVHTLTYPNAVVSLGVAAKDQAVVAGMVDGLVSIKRMIVESEPSHLKQIRESNRFRTSREQQRNPFKEDKTERNPFKADKGERNPFKEDKGERNTFKEYKSETDPGVLPMRTQLKRPKLQNYDIYLRSFDYKKALDSVMAGSVVEKEPEKVVALITELLHRNALAVALSDRPEHVMIRFMRFLTMHLGEVRFMRPLLNAASTVMDILETKVVAYSRRMERSLVLLMSTLNQEIEMTKNMLELKGAMELILGSALDNTDSKSNPGYVETKAPRMYPSKAAENYVVVVD